MGGTSRRRQSIGEQLGFLLEGGIGEEPYRTLRALPLLRLTAVSTEPRSPTKVLCYVLPWAWLENE